MCTRQGHGRAWIIHFGRYVVVQVELWVGKERKGRNRGGRDLLHLQGILSSGSRGMSLFR